MIGSIRQNRQPIRAPDVWAFGSANHKDRLKNQSKIDLARFGGDLLHANGNQAIMIEVMR